MNIKKTIFSQWKKEDQNNSLVKALWVFIGVLFFINLLTFIGWKTSPSRLRVYIPPNISSGTWVKPGDIPPSTVYAFSFQIFSAINTWSTGGSTDYLKNIHSYKNYLTPEFFRELSLDYHTRKGTGGLERKRIMASVLNDPYSPDQVKYLGSGTWLVNMPLHIVETVNGSVVKDVNMDYPLLVSRLHESIQNNPWGLVLDGYKTEPYRLKTNI